MKILHPWDKLENCNNAIFLAGPCPRSEKDYDKFWQEDFIKVVENVYPDFDGIILDPRNPKYGEMGEDAFSIQTNWEWEALRLATVIVFWIDRTDDHPAFTTNIEWGEWFKKDNVLTGGPQSNLMSDNKYLKCRLENIGKEWITDLDEIIDQAMDILNRESESYFTSDTHFGQERTRQFSYRPFRDVHEMDFEMISNWNKTVTNNDFVYHAGDFGEIDKLEYYLGNLNFDTLIWVLGNYDRDAKDKVEEAVNNFRKNNPNRKIEIYEDEYNGVDSLGRTFKIIHEPVQNRDLGEEPNYYLFGHIHGRDFMKRNGFDIASDYWRYAPMSQKQVETFATNLEKGYYDENVLTDRVKKLS